MISLSNIFNRLDLILFFIIFIIIYISLIFLWKKILQLETAFNKLENIFTNNIINKDKNYNSTNNFKNLEEVFVEVFENNKMDNDDNDINDDINNDNDKIQVEEIKNEDEIISENNSIPTKSSLAKMNIEQLKEYCTNNDLSTDGTKKDLINRILI
tara:strand:- start:317 stop:784 length:468 start_codon:yes stop_codon:yes gene_type:complete